MGGILEIPDPQDVSGSMSVNESLTIGTVAKLEPQDPLPSGELGMLAVSSSAFLYFHNGAQWQVVTMI